MLGNFMNIYQLRAFSLLSNNLHYQKTADILGVSQPSLSRSIRALENELGVELFERHGRGVVLSKYGAAFAAHINVAMRELDAGLDRIRELSAPACSNVFISVNYFLSTSYLPALLWQYRAERQNDAFFFQLSQGNTPAILEELRSGVSEIGFCSFMDDQPDIRFEPLIKCPLCAVVPINHPLTKKASTTFKEVSRYPLILSTDKTHYIDDLLRKEGITPKIVLRMGEDRAIANLVAYNYGISILPKEDQLKACGVEMIPLEDESAYRIFYIAISRTHVLSSPARAFYQYALEKSKKHGGF